MSKHFHSQIDYRGNEFAMWLKTTRRDGKVVLRLYTEKQLKEMGVWKRAVSTFEIEERVLDDYIEQTESAGSSKEVT